VHGFGSAWNRITVDSAPEVSRCNIVPSTTDLESPMHEWLHRVPVNDRYYYNVK